MMCDGFTQGTALRFVRIVIRRWSADDEHKNQGRILRTDILHTDWRILLAVEERADEVFFAFVVKAANEAEGGRVQAE